MVEVLQHMILAVGAGVPSSEPLPDTRRVKPVQTRQDHEFLVQLVHAHAYSARLVLLREVLPVPLCKSRYRQLVDEPRRHRLHYVVVQVQQRLVVIEVPEVVRPVHDSVNKGCIVIPNVVVGTT